MRPVIALIALAAAPPATAHARKVLNPTSTLSATLTSGSFSRQDPQMTAALQPGSFLTAGSIDIAGTIGATVSVPAIHVPDVSAPGYTVTGITLTPISTGAATGSLDPFTGAAALDVHLKARVDYTACQTGGGSCYSPPDDDPNQCWIEPIDLALRGTGYDEQTGAVTLRDDSFSIPAAHGNCDPPSADGFFNTALKLPSGPGSSSVVAALQLDPLIYRGVIAAVTATPSGPLGVLIDATGSQVPAGVRSYEFDADADPAGAFEAMTGDGILGVVYPTAGPRVVRVRVTDVDGDSDIASTTVDVQPGQRPPVPSTNGFIAADIVKLPSARRCRSTRTMRLHILQSADAKVGGVTVSVGRRVLRVRGTRLARPVVIGRLPRGAYTVKVVVTLANGKKLTEHRRYRTCPTKA
jgi:hypothetical protein